MQKVNKYLMSTLFILIVTILSLSGVLLIAGAAPQRINCVGNVSYYKNGMVMRISSRLDYSHGSGVAYLSGGVYSGSKLITSVNRTVNFSGTNNAHTFTWTSTDITPTMDEHLDHTLAQKWLPPFYLIKGGKIKFHIYRVNIDSLVFSGVFEPYFICSRP